MSVCVVIKVGEGTVLAADSASSVIGGPVLPDGKPGPQGIVKIFLSGKKLFQLGALPVGVLAWGAGSFKARSVASLIEEFESTEYIRSISKESVDIGDISKHLHKFLNDASDRFFSGIPIQGRPQTGFILSGYSNMKFFPDTFEMHVPQGPLVAVRPDVSEDPDFGANWYGLTDAIVRFHHGRDDRLFDILMNFGIDKTKVSELNSLLQREIQYPVIFNAMPLTDAVLYAKFLVDLTISRYRFVAGAELCGGPVQLATITRREGFRLIDHIEGSDVFYCKGR